MFAKFNGFIIFWNFSLRDSISSLPVMKGFIIDTEKLENDERFSISQKIKGEWT